MRTSRSQITERAKQQLTRDPRTPVASRVRIESERDRWTILNALKIAAEAYERDVETMKQHGALILVDQFERQAKDARDLYERVEESHGFDD